MKSGEHDEQMKCDGKSKIEKWDRVQERFNFVKTIGKKFGINN